MAGVFITIGLVVVAAQAGPVGLVLLGIAAVVLWRCG